MELDTGPKIEKDTSNLSNEVTLKETPFGPPEDENKALKINVGAMIGGIVLLIAVVMLFVVLLSGKKKKEENEAKELDRAGSKYEFSFDNVKDKNIELTETIQDLNENINKNEDEKEEETSDDDLIKQAEEKMGINTQPQPRYSQPAPSSSSKTERPDTRNSHSVRKNVDGLNLVETKRGNANYNNQGVNQNPNSSTNGNYLSKEEFIAQKQREAQMYTSGQNEKQNDNKTEFFNTQFNSSGEGEYLSPYCLWDGTIIPAALQTSIDTQNPGVVIARVTENVYSSYDHSYLIIPEGTLLYATYNSNVGYGQNRIQVAWNLLIRPDGYRMQLGNMAGIDNQGKSGYKGFVNNHIWEKAKALGLVALYSIVETETSLYLDKNNNQYVENALVDVYKEGVKMADNVINKALDIQPSILIKAGKEIKIITNMPLQLPPMERYTVNQKYIRYN